MDGAATEVAVTAADGPTAPTRRARLRLRPLRLSSVRIADGFWAGRQRVNREVAIPAAAEALERAGNFDNLRLAARRAAADATDDALGEYRGRLFADSEVYKWLEALAWEQAREPSEELARWQAGATALVAAAQAPDGYLNSYYQTTAAPEERFSDLAFGHEMYCTGHLIQAGVAQRRASGRSELLDVALRAADNLAATFGPGRRQGVCGHPGVETALIELYRLTGRDDHLALASYFVGARGHGLLGPGPFGPEYWQDQVPVRDARTVEGHTVRALFLGAGAADLAAETGDAALLDAALAQWDDMVSRKTYITGGVGARWEGEAFGDPYELPPDRAYCETCAAHASVLWNWRLLLATGEARFADLIERTLFNAFAAGLSLAGDAYFYTNPLQLRAGGRDTSSRSARHGRRPWYRTACCPPNVMRMLSSLDHYLATADRDGIQLQQYATSTVEHADGRLRVETQYPWDGRVEVTLLATPSREWTLSLRLPSWCETPAASVNGQPVDGAAEPGGYLRLRRAWRPSDTIVLDLPMPPRRTVADERVDAVRGCVAIERGPLVYCVEQADQPDVDHVRLRDGALTVHNRPGLLGGVHVIEALGSVLDAPEHTGLPYHDGADRPVTRPVQLTAIPYYAWANRTVGPMRVWIPSAEP